MKKYDEAIDLYLNIENMPDLASATGEFLCSIPKFTEFFKKVVLKRALTQLEKEDFESSLRDFDEVIYIIIIYL